MHTLNSFKKILLFIPFFIGFVLLGSTKVSAGEFGYNVWWLGLIKDTNEISSTIDFASDSCNTSIIRFWGFRDFNGTPIGEQGIGRVLNAAQGKNIKFIISLEDFNTKVAGNSTNWFKHEYKTNGYRDYVARVVSRFAGRVFMWEIMNEPHCEGDSECPEAMYNFVNDISSLIKQNDPNAYVSPGMKAMNEPGDDLGGYYNKITALPYINANSCHYYSTDPRNNCTEAKNIVKGMRKFFYVGEAGIAASDQSLSERKSQVLSDFSNINADAFLIWNFSDPQTYPHYDKFSVFPNDPLCGGEGGGIPPSTSPVNQPRPIACRESIKGLTSPGWWNSEEWEHGRLPQYVIDAFKDLNAKYVRIGLDWAQIEKSQGNFDYTLFDKIVTTYTKSGITPIGIFVAAPPWIDSSDSTCRHNNLYCDIPKSQEQTFRNAVRNIVGHYKDLGVKYWEFWNEPEHYKNGLNNAETYKFWLNIFYEETKKIDSSIRVGAATDSGWGWFGNIADSANYDAVVVHPYSPSGIDTSEIQQTYDGLVNIGRSDAKIWVTEYGWDMNKTSEEEQAQYLKEALSTLNGMPYVEFAIFHLLADERIVGVNYGLMKGDFFDLGINGTKRKAYNIFKDPYACGYLQLAAGTCEDPLGNALPKEGCYNCYLEGNERGNPCEILEPIPIVRDICKVTRKLAISFTGTIDINDVKSPIKEKDLATWYARVDDNGNIERGDEGRVFRLLTPDEADLARRKEAAEIAKNTPTRIDYEVKAEGLTSKNGYGSTKKYVYGTQHYASVAGCLLWGTPDDSNCNSATPNIVARLQNLQLAQAQSNLEASNTQASPNKESYKTNSLSLQTAVKDIINKYGKEKLLASLKPISGTSFSKTNNALAFLNLGKIFGAPDYSYKNSCPDKEPVPQTNVCKRQIEPPTISGVNIQDVECKTKYIDDGTGKLVPQKEGCELSDTRKASVAPKFHFVNGLTTDGQLGIIEEEIGTNASIFWAPDYRTTETEKLKERNDGKIDFSISANIIGDLGKLGLIGRGLNRVAQAALHIETNSKDGANVYNMKKAECMEYITTNVLTRAPQDAAPIPPECLEPIEKQPQQPSAGTCEDGKGGIDYWTNNVTEFASPPNSDLGHVCGKIILRDPEHWDIPLNPCTAKTKMSCGSGRNGAPYRVVQATNCKPSAHFSYTLRSDGSTISRTVTKPKDCVDIQKEVATNHNLTDQRDFYEVANECIRQLGCSDKDVASYENDKINHIILDIDLPKGPLNNPYVYKVRVKKFCFVDGESAWFSVDNNECISMNVWSTISPPAESTANYCGESSDCAKFRYNITEKNKDMCSSTDKHSWCRLKKALDDKEIKGKLPTAAFCDSNRCPTSEDIIPVRLADLRFYDISCTDANHCYIAANKVENFNLDSNEEGAYIVIKDPTKDHWTVKPLMYKDNNGNKISLEAVYRIRFVNANTGWVVAKSKTDPINVILKTVDGGKTWTRQNHEQISGPNLISIDMLNSNRGVVGPSSKQVIWTTVTGGEGLPNPTGLGWLSGWVKNNWIHKKQELNPSYQITRDSLIDIDMYNENSFMAASNIDTVYNFVKEEDTWKAYEYRLGCGGIGMRMEKIRMANNTLGFAAGRYGCAGVWNGTDWIKVSNIPQNVHLLGLDNWGQKAIFVGSGGRIYSVNGSSAQDVSPTNLNTQNLWAVSIPSPDVIYIVGDGGTIIKSVPDTVWAGKWKKVDDITVSNF